MDYQEVRRELEQKAQEYAKSYTQKYDITDSVVIEAIRWSHYVALVVQLNRVLMEQVS